MRRLLNVVILYSLFSILYSTVVHASGITISPTYQYLTVTPTATNGARPNIFSPTRFIDPGQVHIDQAYIEFTNETVESAKFVFSLSSIQATDVLGRLQFNAPLPQSIVPLDSGLATISPPEMSLTPGEVATVSVTFDPHAIEPGKTAFILLAELQPNDTGPANQKIRQYLGSSIIIRDPINTIPKLQLVRVDPKAFPIHIAIPDFFRLTIKNAGTAPAVTRGLIRITDQFGREIMRGPINEDSATILPGSQRIIYAHLKPISFSFPIAWCQIHLTGYDELHQSNFKTMSYFIYLNPLIVLCIPFGFIVCFIIRKVPSPLHSFPPRISK